MVRGHADWALGFEDETWWSRLEQPHLSSWAETDHPLRLVEKALTKEDPGPKALACYGLLVRSIGSQSVWDETIWLRFVEGNPNSLLTEHFLAWCCEKLQAVGKSVLVLIWDHASWHISRAMQQWIRDDNRQVKRSGQGVRILSCLLPKKAPGSTRLSRCGSMGSAGSLSQSGYYRPRRSLSGFAIPSATLLKPC